MDCPSGKGLEALKQVVNVRSLTLVYGKNMIGRGRSHLMHHANFPTEISHH